jgi:hypothetical protein
MVCVSMGLRSLVGVVDLAIAGLVSLLFGVLALTEPEFARSGTGEGKAGLVSLLLGVLALSDGEDFRPGTGDRGLSIDPDRSRLDPELCRSGTDGGNPSLVTRTLASAGLESLLDVLAMVDPESTDIGDLVLPLMNKFKRIKRRVASRSTCDLTAAASPAIPP